MLGSPPCSTPWLRATSASCRTGAVVHHACLTLYPDLGCCPTLDSDAPGERSEKDVFERRASSLTPPAHLWAAGNRARRATIEPLGYDNTGPTGIVWRSSEGGGRSVTLQSVTHPWLVPKVTVESYLPSTWPCSQQQQYNNVLQQKQKTDLQEHFPEGHTGFWETRNQRDNGSS